MTDGMSQQVGQLVTFQLDNEEFGLPINIVQEIVRPPAITRVPFAPGYIEGIANLRGDILPVVNLRHRLGMPDKEIDNNTRVVVLKTNQSTTGLIVDSVSEVMRVESDRMDYTHGFGAATIDSQFLKAIAKLDNGKRLVLVLEENQILPKVQSHSQDSVPMGTDKSKNKDTTESQKEDQEHLVSFWVGDEEFAIDIMQVKEIIRVNEINSLPDVPPYVLGVISLRDSLIPIIDLQQRFGRFGMVSQSPAFSNGTHSRDTRRIVVVDIDGVTIGLMVHNVSEVLRIEKSQIAPPPSVLGSDDREYIRGIGKLEGGKRLVMLLDVKSLISVHDRQMLAQSVDQKAIGENTMEQDAKSQNEVQLVCFFIDDEEYAINIMKVQEIIRIQQITKIPNAPEYIEGIVNLRGNILPVVDIRSRFGLPKGNRNEQNRIVVVNNGKTTTGLIVDSVSEVLRTYTDNIDQPPESVRFKEKSYFEGVANLDNGKRIILLIDIESLLADDALNQVSSKLSSDQQEVGEPLEAVGENN